MNILHRFLIGIGTDAHNRKLTYILGYTDEDLEKVHNFIQWLFPIDTPSSCSSDAPVVTEEDLQELRNDRRVLLGMKSSFFRMLRFYGLTYKNGQVIKGPNWETNNSWIKGPTHNDLRITRIIRSLTLFGLDQEAEAFLKAVVELHEAERVDKAPPTVKFWESARKA